jgi:hypothetical protein
VIILTLLKQFDSYIISQEEMSKYKFLLLDTDDCVTSKYLHSNYHKSGEHILMNFVQYFSLLYVITGVPRYSKVKWVHNDKRPDYSIYTN